MGGFLTAWTQARIVPIYKKMHYRPILILSTLSKVFESLVYKIFYNHVKNSLSANQHNFIAKKSTSTTLINFISYQLPLTKAYKTVVVVVVVADSKPWNHEIHLRKLHSFGITQNTLNWWKSYLDTKPSSFVIDGVKVPS